MVEAENRVKAVLGDSAAQSLSGVTIELADLSDGVLAQTSDRSIRIDRDAAAYGWFIDPTPQDDAEFGAIASSRNLNALLGGAADRRVDLLTTVMHEMGHELGLDQSSQADWMDDLLPVGVRRLPQAV